MKVELALHFKDGPLAGCGMSIEYDRNALIVPPGSTISDSDTRWGEDVTCWADAPTDPLTVEGLGLGHYILAEFDGDGIAHLRWDDQ